MGHVNSVIFDWNNSNVVFGSSTGGETEFSGHKEKVKVNVKPEIDGDGNISTAPVLTPYRPGTSTNSTRMKRRGAGDTSTRSTIPTLDGPHVSSESIWPEGEYARKSNSTSSPSSLYFHPTPSSADFDAWVKEVEAKQVALHREEQWKKFGIGAGVAALVFLVLLFAVAIRCWWKDRKSKRARENEKERRKASSAEREGEGWIVQVDLEGGGQGWASVPL